MVFDFKKSQKEIYAPKATPSVVNIPKMNFIAFRGKGDPNKEDGNYKKGLSLIYPLAYTLKMSYKGDYRIKDFFEYVVPPLEGFWWQDHIKGVDYAHKDTFNFISVLRLPDFITIRDFNWAVTETERKKKLDLSNVEFLTIDEGLCVQCLHIGSYDDEPKTVALMHQYLEENDYQLDINDHRLHHEIYLSDPRKTDISKLKTIIRHPIKKI